MQRLILTLVLLLSVALVGVGETYQITALTTPSITIGGKKLKVGDRFDSSNNIKWIDNDQKMEVKALSTGALYIFSHKVFQSKGGALSIADYFLKTGKGSSRGHSSAPIFTASSVRDKFPEKRIALVMGNSNYENLSYLKNAQRDASDLAETFKQLGFDVMETYESDYSGMKTALNNFTSKAKNYDVALFYYAGHGIQEKGHNYLVPIERALELPSEVEYCLNCDDVMDLLEEARVPAKLMFIDACRHTKKSWSRAADKGLARMEGPAGSVIIFSTQSGNEALDGTGSNSPFAEALLKNIRTPGLSFNDVMQKVVTETHQKTNGEQCPLTIGMLLKPFSFNPVTQRPEESQGVTTASQNKVPATVQGKTTSAASSDLTDRLKRAKDLYSKKDYTGAFKLFDELSAQGNAEAQNYLGDMYYYGRGVAKDYEEAVKWYRKAADQGNSYAQANLGYMYKYGYGVAKDYEEAVKWYRKAAYQDNVAAQYQLGVIYYNGSGVAKDYAEALKWYRKAADQRHSHAQNNLGIMYWNGHGVTKDFGEAMKWFRKAADQGYVNAQYNVGYMYENGYGVVKDYSEAYNWYKKAADQGYAQAQCNLGYMYENGYVVTKDYAEAVKWYQKAADQGNETAKKWISEHQATATSAETVTVTGVVMDETGEPIIGASVIVEERKTGVATDLDGNFTLKNVPVGSVVKVSYIEHQPQTVKITSNEYTHLIIKLKQK